MDGWTGLDIERTRREINEFNESSYKTENSLREMYDHFFVGIENDWASPNAVTFSKDAIDKALGLYYRYVETRNHIINSALQAAEALAEANGAHFNSSIDISHNGLILEYYKGCNETNNGVTGMQIRNIENRKEALQSESRVVVDLLNGLPNQISFYDVEGNLMSAYQTNIRSFGARVEELNTSIVSNINRNIISEVLSLRTGKQKAEEILKEAQETSVLNGIGEVVSGALSNVTSQFDTSLIPSQTASEPSNLYIDSKSGWVFPIANSEGSLDKMYGQFGTESQAGGGSQLNGIDIAADLGTDVHAATDSEVYYSGLDTWSRNGKGGYGNCVVLKSVDSSTGETIYQIYGHLQDNPGLVKGSTVKAGQVIGQVGNTGNAPGGSYLHYELRNGLNWLDDLSLDVGNYYSFNK